MSTGPITDPPPSGPRWLLANLRKIAGEIAAQHAAAKGRAQVAGSYGRHAQPLDDLARIERYWAQNGHANGLTPKQRRRAEHKAARRFYRDPANA